MPLLNNTYFNLSTSDWLLILLPAYQKLGNLYLTQSDFNKKKVGNVRYRYCARVMSILNKLIIALYFVYYKDIYESL